MEPRARKRMTRNNDSRMKRVRILEGVKEIDTNDPEFLRKFVSDHGSIMPARVTGATAKQQRQIQKAVKRMRNIGLLP